MWNRKVGRNEATELPDVLKGWQAADNDASAPASDTQEATVGKAPLKKKLLVPDLGQESNTCPRGRQKFRDPTGLRQHYERRECLPQEAAKQHVDIAGSISSRQQMVDCRLRQGVWQTPRGSTKVHGGRVPGKAVHLQAAV